MWIQSQHFNPVWHFDATGSIIRNIPGEKIPLLYSMVSHDTSTKIIFPVFEFVTTSHSEDNLAKLSTFPRRLFREIPNTQFFPIAPVVVMDFSWASINASVESFNNCNFGHYINWSYDVLFKIGDTLQAINALIYLCSTHMLKLTVDKVKKSKFSNKKQ